MPFPAFFVELTLGESSEQLKEQLVGVEVFDGKGDYDPRTDPIVRVEARRLRSKLKAYYTSSGKSDGVLIELPKAAYVPSRGWLGKVDRRSAVREPDAGGECG